MTDKESLPIITGVDPAGGQDKLVVRFRAAGRNEETYILKGNAAARFLEMQEYQEKYEKLRKKVEDLLDD